VTILIAYLANGVVIRKKSLDGKRLNRLWNKLWDVIQSGKLICEGVVICRK